MMRHQCIIWIVLNKNVCSEEREVAKENGNGSSRGLIGSSVSQKIGISLVDDDVGIVFKVSLPFCSPTTVTSFLLS
jgi:hypothetical protein